MRRDAERELAERARGGDRGAFESLVRLHYRRVAGLAFRLVGNPEDAEDLTQECFVRAHHSLSWYRGEGAFGAWLRRILVHLARDRFRARGRRPESEVIDLEGLAGREAEPSGELGARELARLIDVAVVGLPDSQRIAFLLRTRAELDYAEIAEATGVTVQTVRTQVQRARRALRRRLGRHIDARISRMDRRDGDDPQGGGR